MLAKLREYKEAGFYIILYTSRNMRTYGGNIGLITANTAKATMAWLDRHGIPYDEIHFGKPWASRVGFYVDDRAVRPDEFLRMTPQEICRLLEPTNRMVTHEKSSADADGKTCGSRPPERVRADSFSHDSTGQPASNAVYCGTVPQSRLQATSRRRGTGRNGARICCAASGHERRG